MREKAVVFAGCHNHCYGFVSSLTIQIAIKQSIVLTFFSIFLVFRDSFSQEDLLEAKQAGFSDRQLAKLIGVQESDMRNERLKHGVKPWVKQVCIVNKSRLDKSLIWPKKVWLLNRVWFSGSRAPRSTHKLSRLISIHFL